MAGNKECVMVRQETTRKRLKSLRSSPLSKSSIEEVVSECRKGNLSFLEGLCIVFPKKVRSATRMLEKESGLVNFSSIRYTLLNSDIPRCSVCSKFCMGKICCRCSPKSEQHKESIAKSILENGGTLMLRPSVREKFKATMLRKYGVEWAGASKELQEKTSKTNILLTGKSRWIQTNSGKTRMAELNSDPEYVKKVTSNRMRSMQIKYGDEWRILSHTRLSNSRYKYKEIKLGKKIFKCQGYEPVVLRYLFDRGVDLKGVLLSKVAFPYHRKERRHVYLPDIVFPDGMVIEVKSSYTAGFGKNPSAISIWKTLQLKSRAVFAAGRNLDLVVCDSKRVILRIRNPHSVSRDKAIRLYSDALALAK